MSEINNILTINNGETIDLEKITHFSYDEFSSEVISLLNQQQNHCVAYYAYQKNQSLNFIIAIADDINQNINLLSHQLPKGEKRELNSLTQYFFALHIFEREINENFGVNFINHPWQKPVRYAFNRANLKSEINEYPFYSIESKELHEVGVGPIHAGIIEPGHFRFICNGENVLHLEIQLGWQHRGIEQLFLSKKKNLQRNILAENIAGDTVIGHTSSFVSIMESLSNKQINEQIYIERALALELERIAIHINDIAGLCTDVAYLIGANVFGVLRTGIINFIQSWCGNRFGKGLVRIGGTYFPFTEELKTQLLKTLDAFEEKFIEISHITYRLPSVQNRFDFVGEISEKQARMIGTVGVSARMSNINRDVRVNQPNYAFQKFSYETITAEKGDVFARFLLKRKEIKKSIAWIRNVLINHTLVNSNIEKPDYNIALKPNAFCLTLNEGWRGEICHCAITDEKGELLHYKIKDPSMHNWKALELSLRNEEISDFPINNKSYNLSYCGHDL